MNESPDLPVSIVIFGASGDLTHRKLIPSLFNLYLKKRLPKEFQVIGFSNNKWTNTQFRNSLLKGLGLFAEYKYKRKDWKEFSKNLFYITGDFTNAGDFSHLRDVLQKEESTPAGRLFYLATPPQFFVDIALNLGAANLLDQKESWRRVIIEKPFGSDLKTARHLNQTLHKVLDENQIFRIDHYLGKETVQNLLILRFANTIFEPVWNCDYIDHVQISVAEEVGVGHRAGYYDHAGVVRDMFQNHLLQLLMMVAIEPPTSFRSKDLHARKIEILKSLRPITGKEVQENTVRGQYKIYRQEPGVAPDSQTATFAAMRVYIDNPRWQGVPFYLRSGKELAHKCTEITIQFKRALNAVFPMPAREMITPNLLSICIQPNEGIFLRFEAKVPDTEADMRSVEMEFHYSSSFGHTAIPEAYERLILEAIQGDHMLFTKDETTELAWKWIDPIMAAWENPQEAPPLLFYESGSWGPAAADHLLKKGQQWQITCGEHNNE